MAKVLEDMRLNEPTWVNGSVVIRVNESDYKVGNIEESVSFAEAFELIAA